MTPKRKRLLKIIITLSIIWFAIVVPVPLLLIYPGMRDSMEYQTYLVISILVSIPLIIRGIIWAVKPPVTET
ncbi:MAG TPA: hypothetical protein VJ771_00875 [Candidatus Nitrosotalea sp.]|nr:hypothetical protein [Candidatus Nitrosotalea sp.]